MACKALWPRFVLETTVAISDTHGISLDNFMLDFPKTIHEIV